MKLLHTSDWHLGKLFFEHSLHEDQLYFFSQLKEELKAEEEKGQGYHALVIAGDIYDRQVAPSDSVYALGVFISELHEAFPSLHIFMTAGNHDSAERLSFLQAPLSKQNIHICSDCKNMTTPVIVDDTAVYQLPYLTPGCVRNKEEADLFERKLRSQQELLDEAVRQIEEAHKKNYGGMQSLLCAHLFASGADIGESERNAVGTADQIDAKTLSPFTYVALGHIHSAQKAAKNAWYSGSPLSYSFNEKLTKKFFMRVILSNGKFELEKISVKPLHEVSVICDTFENALHAKKYEDYRDNYIQVLCKDTELIANPMSLLRTRFPNILSFTYAQRESSVASATLEERRKLLNKKGREGKTEIFNAFLEDLYGKENLDSDSIVKKEKALFQKLAAQLEDEE